MKRPAAAIALLLAVAFPAGAQELPPEVKALLQPHRLGSFPPLYRRALDTFVRTEKLLAAGKAEGAARLLHRFWADNEPGTGAWLACDSKVAGVFVGSPPCYYALRMLTDIAEWQARPRAKQPPATATATLTVVLVGRAAGKEPRSTEELEADDGHEVQHRLRDELLAGESRIVHASLQLFADYIAAITLGRLTVETKILHLPDLEVRVRATSKPERHAGLADGATERIWAAIPEATIAATDWWWVLYPSHVPEQHLDFADTEFITGGMATGPDGDSPCFLIDDRWLLRKPPHLGRGDYSELERRVYLPQWLQHEFFHHLFRSYPEFGLEKAGHQWFDRSTWPADFVGLMEPDYYHEALHKVLQPKAKPPLHVRLRYRGPPAELVRRIGSDRLAGEYVREPHENDYHRGTITREGDSWRWTNDAGVSWSLLLDAAKARLLTGAGNPYADNPTARAFRLELARDADGGWLPELVGFRFLGEFYRKR